MAPSIWALVMASPDRQIYEPIQSLVASRLLFDLESMKNGRILEVSL